MEMSKDISKMADIRVVNNKLSLFIYYFELE